MVSTLLSLAFIRSDKEDVSVTFSFVENLVVKFNKLVSDVLNFVANLLVKFKLLVSDVLNFVANLPDKFNKLVSDKLDLALMRLDNEAVSV